MGRFSLVVVAICSLAACKEKQKQGLPPAQEWSADTTTMPNAKAPMANPHAGMAMGAAGANPHAGMDMGGGDPHAGMDIQNPHGGGGPDVTQMGLPAPDPNRKIDPANHVKGVIKVHAKAKDKAAAGGAVFVIVKKAGPDGAPSGPPLAVEKLTWQKDQLPFEMTEAQAMIAGTQLTGDVVVTARYDQDGDALSKQPGDISGSIRVKIPADNVTLTLDDVLQ
jgi:hypothetical protein